MNDSNAPQKRMVSAEQKAYLELWAAISQLGIVEKGLERRIRTVPRGKNLLHSACGLLTKLAEELAATTPREQQAHLARQLKGLYMHVGVKDLIAQQKRDAEIGRLMTFTELDVVATAIRECCRACTIDDPQEQKQCIFARLLDVLPTDKPDEYAHGCGYFSIW